MKFTSLLAHTHPGKIFIPENALSPTEIFGRKFGAKSDLLYVFICVFVLKKRHGGLVSVFGELGLEKKITKK